jgi:hypothetical protein
LTAVGNLTVTAVRPTGQKEGPGVDAKQFFAFIFPGLVIFGVMFISQSLALRLLRDRVRGVERRLMMTPLSPRAQIAGAFLFMAAGLLLVLTADGRRRDGLRDSAEESAGAPRARRRIRDLCIRAASGDHCHRAERAQRLVHGERPHHASFRCSAARFFQPNRCRHSCETSPS